jgi:Mg2+ and Co2+ transporter CorA
MSTTRAILKTTDDTRGMKVISILGVVFLPFTFVAVCYAILNDKPRC